MRHLMPFFLHNKYYATILGVAAKLSDYVISETELMGLCNAAFGHDFALRLRDDTRT